MSAAWLAAGMLLAWAGLLAAGWVAVRALIAVDRAGAPAVRPDLERLTVLPGPERRSYLRHPLWTCRCACGEYGLPRDDDGDVVEVRDDGGQHAEHRCQPERETIRGER